MTESVPKYEKRFGFYWLIVGIIFSANNLLQTLMMPSEFSGQWLSKFIRPSKFSKEPEEALQVLDWLSDLKISFVNAKIVFALGLVGSILISAFLLYEPKMTMTKGHFWTLTGITFACMMLSCSGVTVFFHENIDSFLNVIEKIVSAAAKKAKGDKPVSPDEVMDLFRSMKPLIVSGCFVFSLIISASFSLVNSAIMTMDESYRGACSCLKCLKPYKLVETLPEYMHDSKSFYPKY